LCERRVTCEAEGGTSNFISFNVLH
jgi:hypothetical protein